MTVGTSRGSKDPGSEESMGTQIRPIVRDEEEKVYRFQGEHRTAT